MFQRVFAARDVRALLSCLSGFLLTLLVLAGPGLAADYYVTAGAKRGDGSEAAPWSSLDVAFGSGKLRGGDRLILAGGSYGEVTVAGWHFDPPLTIASGTKDRAHLERLRVNDSSGLVFRDLDIWPLKSTGRTQVLVAGSRDSHDITLDRLDIRGGPTALDYYDWTAEDWLTTWRSTGVMLAGPDMTISNSTLTAVANGIGMQGVRGQVIGNEIRGFSKDGLRAFGEGTVLRGNTVRDCINVDENHDDGFQTWAKSGGAPDEIRDITLDGNRIFEWTGPADHPLRGRLQGIGLFKGPYYDLVIENNLIVVNAPHGIALYDVIGSRIVNNTVIGFNKRGQGIWIMEIRQKVAADAPANLIANNIATGFRLGKGQVATHGNKVVRQIDQVFENPGTFDYRLRANSALLGTADATYAPEYDLTGSPRSGKTGPDPGAFQRH
jgi:hypothetical protein